MKKYMDWANAGGPNECKHGYAAGIPCPDCDRISKRLTDEELEAVRKCLAPDSLIRRALDELAELRAKEQHPLLTFKVDELNDEQRAELVRTLKMNGRLTVVNGTLMQEL